MTFDQRIDCFHRHPACRRHPLCLHKSRLGADVGVEPRGASGDQVGWDIGPGQSFGAEFGDVSGNAVAQILRSGGKVAGGRGAGVIAVARCRRPRVEIARAGEALADQAGADDTVANGDKTAIGLPRKNDLGDAGDGQRVCEAEQQREQNEQRQRGAELADHSVNPQARWRPETAISMSLMPMNGATSPPTP